MAQKSMAPLGTQISYALKARGVDVVFGIPGVHNQELYRGLEEAGLRHILARHEQGAGFMADGYARATGRAGVAFVITGPGLCNIMTALGQAYSDSVPLLVFSSCLDDIETRKGQLHQMKDQLAAAATVCDWSELAQSDAQVYRLIDQAFAEFAHQRPRPKHIQIPITSLAAPAAQPLPRAPAPVAGDIAKSSRDAALGEKAVGYFRGGRARGFRDAVIAAAGCCKLYHLRRAGGG
jgi:acetolactate synthase-1/2/3 large subunit/5-guanidino-2-oxopentanoate decarboxylase